MPEERLRPNVDLEPNAECDENKIEVKVYKRRWFIVILFTLFAFSNSIQWIQFTIITNISSRYFSVSDYTIEWTAFVNNISGLILIYPLSYLSHKIDVRYACLTASIVICIAAWIKALAISPDRFILIFIAQAMVGCWEIVLVPTPAVIAAYWFGPEQASTAVALGSLGMPVGLATFSVLTPIVVKNHENLKDITKDLYVLLLGVAIYCTIVTALLIIFFKNEPKLPPSKSRAVQKKYREQNFVFWTSIKRILTNKNFIILCNAHAINVACVTNIATLMNSLYLPHFPNQEEDVGRVSLLIMIAGLVGRTVFARIQDKWRKYKQLSVLLYIGTILTEVFLAVALHTNRKWVVFLAAALFGFIALSYSTTGFETCIESTYPESEAICVIVLNAVNQIFGILLLVIGDKVARKYGDIGTHVSAIVLLIIGMILNISAKDIQRRQYVDKNLK